MQRRRTLFNVAYGSIYFLFYILLAGLLLITPGDAIERSIQNRQIYNIWIVTIAYLVTVAIVCFVYVLRLYVNKTALDSIPKVWIPTEKGDVKDKVHRMISAGLDRSAVIAYEARPRVEEAGDDVERIDADRSLPSPDSQWIKTAADELYIKSARLRDEWHKIEHNGWSSPNSPDLPNLQYNTVISEIPNLVEAKAMKMAPKDTKSAPLPMLNFEAVTLLQRLPNMSLREYIQHLARHGILAMNDSTVEFLWQYEYARFSNRTLTSGQFRELMRLFAKLLQAMQPLDVEYLRLHEDRRESDGGVRALTESDYENNAPTPTAPSSRPSSIFRIATTSTQGTVRRPLMDNSTASFRAPSEPSGSKAAFEPSTRSSSSRFATTRRTIIASHSSQSGSDTGSVIRLAGHADPDDGLPYVFSRTSTDIER